jgi:anti-sigma B factor antagonist
VPSDGEFELTVTEQSGATVVYAKGELDVASAPQLKAELAGLIAAGSRVLVVDLSEVGFVDSSGLGVLIGAHNEVSRVGGEIRVVVQPQVKRILELTSLDEVFTIVDPTNEPVKP